MVLENERAWDEFWLDDLSDLLPSERRETVGVDSEGRLTFCGNVIPWGFLRRFFKAAYYVKVFPGRAEGSYRYDVYVGSDRYSLLERGSKYYEFQKNGAPHCTTGPAMVDENRYTFAVNGEQVDAEAWVCDRLAVGVTDCWAVPGNTAQTEAWYRGDYAVLKCPDGTKALFKKANVSSDSVKATKKLLSELAFGWFGIKPRGFLAGYEAETILHVGPAFQSGHELLLALREQKKKFRYTFSPVADDDSFLISVVEDKGGFQLESTPVISLDAQAHQFKVHTPDAVIVHDLAKPLMAPTRKESTSKMLFANLAPSTSSAAKTASATSKTTQGVRMTTQNEPATAVTDQTRVSTVTGGISSGIKKGAVRVASDKAAKWAASKLPVSEKLPMASIAQLVLLNAGAELIERVPDGAGNKIGLNAARREASGYMLRSLSGEIMGRNLAELFTKIAPKILDGVSTLTADDISEAVGVDVEKEEAVPVPSRAK